MLPGAEQDRRHSQVHLINQTRLQVLADGGDASTKTNVVLTGRGGFKAKSACGL
jgi:hypothetical protein